MAKYLDDNGLLYFWQKIKNAFVSKETGKGLSTNDYTTAEKNKLAGLNNYTLPKASDDTLGGVKVGEGLSIDNDGVLSADVSGDIPTKTSDLTNDSGFITNATNGLVNYELKTATGNSVELSINTTTYVMTLNLKNSAGTVISTDTVDLPLESMVVSGSYNDTTKKIVLTLQGGSTVEFSVADLVSGLVSESSLATTLQNYVLNTDLVAITNAEIDTIVAS